MSLASVREYFQKRSMEHRILEFDVSSATVDLAALAVGVIPARIGKTLSFKDGEGCLLIIVAGDAKVNNSKFKAQFGIKPKMLAPDEVLALTGHAVGGVCPFAIENPAVKIYTDISLKRFETIFPACGSDASAIELNCDELFQHAQSRGWVDVCIGWQEAAEGAH